MLHQYSAGGGHHHQNVTSPGAMAASTFSLFFPLPKGQQWLPQAEEAAYSYGDRSTVTSSVPSSPASSSSTGSVDCTLSLGTPSSRRLAGPAERRLHGAAPQPCPSSVSAATLSWDAAAESYYYQQGNKPAARGAVGHDQLLDRRCANCGTSSTPLWRNGPRGPKSLCNACGIRFKKEERRAAESGGAGAGCGYAAQRAHVSVPGAHRAVSYGAEEALPCGGAGADADAPFLAWRLNVVPPAAAAAAAFSVWPERASLYQYN